MCGGVTALAFLCVCVRAGVRVRARVLLAESLGHRSKRLAVTVEVTLSQYSCH